MFVVMALLLIVTATGTLAIHSTSIELRGVGNARRAMQTRYLAEGGLNAALSYSERDSEALDVELRESADGDDARNMSPNEPPMAPDAELARVSLARLRAMSATGPLVAPDSLGRGMGYEADVMVDFNDDLDSPQPIAGEATGAQRARTFVELITTSHARTQLVGRSDAYSPTQSVTGAPAAADWRVRGYHESTMDARASVLVSMRRRPQ